MSRFPLQIPVGKREVLVVYPVHLFFLVTMTTWFIVVLYSLLR
jgi:hypothetical protein